MKRKTKPTRQVKQYVPAFLRPTDRPRGQVAMGVIHDQTMHGAQRLAAWNRKAAAAPVISADDGDGAAGRDGGEVRK